MSDLPSKYDITKRDLARGRNLKAAAVVTPIAFTVIPALVTLAALLVFAPTPPVAATILFFGFIITLVGMLKGLIFGGIFGYRYARWKDGLRERIAADGIKASEVDWFRKELRPHEKRALKEIERNDLLLGDAYRETLAARLTAARILRSTKRELMSTRRRESRIKQLRAGNSERFLSEIKKDEAKLESIKHDAADMLAEAESRLQMIEAAALRGSSIAGSEIALKKLMSQRESLPLALESAILAEEIGKELEKEMQEGERSPDDQ